MKYNRLILFALLMSLSFPVMAQTNKEQPNKKDDSRAKIEVVNGQNALVLKTGRKSQSSSWGSSYSADIVLKLDGNTWDQLDSLITASYGSSIKLKDLQGYNVEIAKANVNSHVGLMFTSGSKCVAISKEEFERLRN